MQPTTHRVRIQNTPIPWNTTWCDSVSTNYWLTDSHSHAVYKHTHKHAYKYVQFIYPYIHTHVYIHIYIYIYTYTHVSSGRTWGYYQPSPWRLKSGKPDAKWITYSNAACTNVLFPLLSVPALSLNTFICLFLSLSYVYELSKQSIRGVYSLIKQIPYMVSFLCSFSHRLW